MLLFKLAEATHIVGGEIYYDYLGGNNYKISMKVYRDCLNGIPPFDGFPANNGNIIPAYFTVYDVFDNPVISSTFNAISFSTVPPTNNSLFFLFTQTKIDLCNEKHFRYDSNL